MIQGANALPTNFQSGAELVLIFAKTLLIVLGTIGGLYGLVCWILWRWQERLTFLPSRRIVHTPEEYGLDYEELWLPVPQSQGDRLHSWWLSATNTTPAVLLLHGNGFNIGANLPQAKVFHDLGYPVLLVDYRGYGRSEGPFANEPQVYTDAQVALNYLQQGRGLQHQDIIVFGHSMGGAIAIELAQRNPNLGALIIQGSFTSLRQMVDHDGIYGWLPIDRIMRQSFDSIAKVPHLKMPLFFVHGDGDRRVPSWMSEQLYAAATAAIKELYILPGVDHNHVPEMGSAAYVQRVRDFLNRIVPEHLSNLT